MTGQIPRGEVTNSTDNKRELTRERYKLAAHISRALATPMTILGLIWLVLLVVDLTSGLSPFLRALNYVIWGLFVLQFAIEFFVSPRKLVYLKRNWITAVALLLPAARLLGVFRAARALATLRGVRLIRIVTRTNRGMRALGRVMGRRGFRYIASLSGLVAIVGAAGMYTFERGVQGSTLDSYPSALWWSAMVLTTMGSDYFPKTAPGRLLCLLLALYGFSVFGYFTATVASFFVARDADTKEGEVAGAKQIEALQKELAALHGKIDALSLTLTQRATNNQAL